jgi:pimeloyl-ACP methyl ester carboxylesterase
MQRFSAHHDRIDIAYQRFGHAGDPLLLITGIGADRHYWRDDFCTALVQQGFQMARFDNHGRGDPPTSTGPAHRIAGWYAGTPTPHSTGLATDQREDK